jgi:hypothetical protein
MVNNLIVIKGGTVTKIKKALSDWTELYFESLEPQITFEIFTFGSNVFVIKADEHIDNLRFNFLINYLKYPVGINYTIEIKGFTTALDPQTYPLELLNQTLMVYISENDSEFDNVFIVTESKEAFKIDFSGKATRINDNVIFELPKYTPDQFTNSEIVIIKKDSIKIKKQAIQNNKLKERFRIITFIALILIILSTLFLFFDHEVYSFIIFILGFIATSWLFIDFKILQNNVLYFKLLVYSLLFLGYNMLIEDLILHFENRELTTLGAIFPLIFLIIQRPLRLIFIYINKREPIVDRPPPTSKDGAYSMFLFFAAYLIPVLIVYN